jgi:(p)ppGpp synthase/HD superfamily hydrolase
MTEEQLHTFERFAVSQHEAVNHLYDEYLPYQHHLLLVVKNGKRFKHLIKMFKYNATQRYWNYEPLSFEVENSVIAALWGHDLFEDTHVNYNWCKEYANEYTCELIFALTNSKGRNRKERQDEAYYKGLREVPGAIFCKLCDRIANVEYGKLMGSRQIEMYKKENSEFVEKLYDENLKEMFDYLNDLLK